MAKKERPLVDCDYIGRLIFQDQKPRTERRDALLWEATRGLVRQAIERAIGLGYDVYDYADPESPAGQALPLLLAAWSVPVSALAVGDHVFEFDPKSFRDVLEGSVSAVRFITPEGEIWSHPRDPRSLVRLDIARYSGEVRKSIIRVPADFEDRRKEYASPSFWLEGSPDAPKAEAAPAGVEAVLEADAPAGRTSTDAAP